MRTRFLDMLGDDDGWIGAALARVGVRYWRAGGWRPDWNAAAGAARMAAFARYRCGGCIDRWRTRLADAQSHIWDGNGCVGGRAERSDECMGVCAPVEANWRVTVSLTPAIHRLCRAVCAASRLPAYGL